MNQLFSRTLPNLLLKAQLHSTPCLVLHRYNKTFQKTEKKIKGIKIDTEGEDFKALQGSFKLIEEFKPKIIIEVRNTNKSNIQKFLEKLNYELFDIDDLKNKVNLNDHTIQGVSNILANPL